MFRFSIREIALLTLAVAIGMGWAVDRWHIGTSLQKMTEARYELLKAKQAEAKARMELARMLHSLSKPSKSADPDASVPTERASGFRSSTEEGMLIIDLVHD